MDANLILGLTSIATSFLGNKKEKLPAYEKVAAPNLKMMDETTVSNQKEQVVTAGRALLDRATSDIKQTANAASGLRSGKTYENMFDVSGKIAADTAGKMTDIDMQALDYNNRVLQFVANFNASQNAAAANRQYQQVQMTNANRDDNSAALAGLGKVFLSKDDKGNYVNDLSKIFGNKKKSISNITDETVSTKGLNNRKKGTTNPFQ